MAENNIVKAKGFINKNGEKVLMIPAEHEHQISEVTGLQDALDGKAAASHMHPSIQDSEGMRAKVECKKISNTEDGAIHLYVEGNDGDSGSADIKYDNISNLNRALRTPSSTPEDDAAKLITSKAVYESLKDRAVLSFSIDRTPLANPTFSSTAVKAKNFVSDFVENRPYACLVTINSTDGLLQIFAKAGGIAVWGRDLSVSASSRKVTIYVGFQKLVSGIFTDATNSQTELSWTLSDIDSDFLSNNAVGSESPSLEDPDPNIGGGKD